LPVPANSCLVAPARSPRFRVQGHSGSSC
jgi:hypothetical protein